MKNEIDITNEAKRRLVELLQDTGIVEPLQNQWTGRAKGTASSPEYDLSLNVNAGAEKWTLLVDAKLEGQPRQARAASWQLKRKLEQSTVSKNVYLIFFAPYISEKSAAICLEEDIGYLDLAGNCHIAFSQLYIHIEGCPNPWKEKRGIKSLFAPKASRISRVMLSSEIRPWKVEELASESAVSLGSVSNVRTLLLDQEFAVESNDGLVLENPELLLRKWQENAHRHRDRSVMAYAMGELPEWEDKISRFCADENLPYACTGLIAASRLAPMVPYGILEFYVSNPESVVDALSLKPVESGGNIRLIKPVDEGVYHQCVEREGLKVVSAIQAYVDLYGARERREEAAENLLSEVIRQRWVSP